LIKNSKEYKTVLNSTSSLRNWKTPEDAYLWIVFDVVTLVSSPASKQETWIANSSAEPLAPPISYEELLPIIQRYIQSSTQEAKDPNVLQVQVGFDQEGFQQEYEMLMQSSFEDWLASSIQEVYKIETSKKETEHYFIEYKSRNYMSIPILWQPENENNNAACSDGTDNDSDGFIDCKDPDCEEVSVCLENNERTCQDGVDNDLDGFVDCSDSECSQMSICRDIHRYVDAGLGVSFVENSDAQRIAPVLDLKVGMVGPISGVHNVGGYINLQVSSEASVKFSLGPQFHLDALDNRVHLNPYIGLGMFSSNALVEVGSRSYYEIKENIALYGDITLATTGEIGVGSFVGFGVSYR